VKHCLLSRVYNIIYGSSLLYFHPLRSTTLTTPPCIYTTPTVGT
jgi:hypothetical protein